MKEARPRRKVLRYLGVDVVPQLLLYPGVEVVVVLNVQGQALLVVLAGVLQRQRGAGRCVWHDALRELVGHDVEEAVAIPVEAPGQAGVDRSQHCARDLLAWPGLADCLRRPES